MMNDSTDATCGTDAVRCLYLARATERLGHATAARRWYAKADRWLEAMDPGKQQSITEAKNRSGTDRQLP